MAQLPAPMSHLPAPKALLSMRPISCRGQDPFHVNQLIFTVFLIWFCCRLRHAVEALEQCTRLRRLRFEHNFDMTDSLHNDMACLEQLEYFSMVDCGLQSIPEIVADMASVTGACSATSKECRPCPHAIAAPSPPACGLPVLNAWARKQGAARGLYG